MKKLKMTLLLVLTLVVSVAFAALAGCGEKGVRLTFDTHGAPSVAEQTLTKGEAYTLPDPPVYEGYSFEGWYLDANYSGSPVTNGVADKDTTFHAKWEQMYLVTLDLGGGTIGGSSAAPKIYLKKGANIAEGLQAYVPVKAGYEFGGWFSGETELSKSATMTKSGISLTARYKVGYTVKVFLQNLTDDNYTAGEDITGFAYAAKGYTPSVSMQGFEKVANANSLETLDLNGDDPAQNVFRFYFDRLELAVVLDANYPDGDGTARQEITFRYGEEVELPTDAFSYTGYMLRGWATEANGEVVYASQTLDGLIYGAEKVEPERFTFATDTMLFAVWTKGYTDVFGGTDCLYLFDESGRDIYLDRDGKYFKGTFTPSTREFYFVNSADTTVVSGRLNTDGTFVYYNPSLEDITFSLYSMPAGVQADERIILDAYNGIRYVVTGGMAPIESRGTYKYQSDTGFYIATFTSGVLARQTLTIRLGTTTSGANVFLVRNADDLAYGQMLRTFVQDGRLLSYTSAYMLSLDGFGTATLNQGTSNTSLSYYWQDDVLYLLTSTSLYGTFKTMPLQNGYGYIYYNAQEVGTYTTSDSATLTLDGLYTATYTYGTTSVTGFYSSASSMFGNGYEIVTLVTEDATTYTFLTHAESVTTPPEEEGGDPETHIERTFELRANGYAEYLYCGLNSQGSQAAYYSAMLVLNETEAGKATLYGYNSAGEYVKAAAGTYEEKDGVYSFTVTQQFEVDETNAELYNTPYDVRKIRACVFRIGTFTMTNGSLQVAYWLSVTLENEQPTALDVQFTAENGDTLSLVAGFAIFKTTIEGEEFVVAGSYSQSGNRIQLTVSQGSLYFEIDAEQHSFVVLSGLLGSAGESFDGYVPEEGATLTFDGKGNATYTKGEEEPIVGTASDTGDTTVFGTTIYEFKSASLTFRFLLVSQSSRTYFARENTTLTRSYTSEEYGTLTLDGFGFRARYTNAYNTSFDGNYSVSQNAVLFTTTYQGAAVRIYFDLQANGFTMRGSEYGTYLDFNNQYAGGLVYALDGYGHLTVTRIVRNDDGSSTTEEVANNGTYTERDGGYLLVYDEGSTHHEVFGRLSVFYLSQTSVVNVFIVEMDSVTRVLVNENDFSVLTLDGFGNAVYTDELGRKENGQYVLVTDSLFYFATNSGSVANIYQYDYTKGTATPVSMRGQGYYTEDLESMLFTQYGFMIKDGTERYYYGVVNGEVTIYRQDPVASPDKVNQYGFIETPFGKFEATKQYEGKTYYLSDGYSINFARTEGKETEYPIPGMRSDGTTFFYLIEGLSFTPAGSTFEETAVVTLRQVESLDATEKGDPLTQRGTIVRTRNEDGTYATYVDFAGYRIDVTISYHGSDANGFEIGSLSAVTTAYSLTYLQYYQLFATLGIELPNTFGAVEIVTPITIEGEAQEPYLTADFGDRGDIPDTLNAPLKIEKQPFRTENSLFIVTIKGTDHYDYNFYISISQTQLGYGYTLVAAARVETFESNGYTVSVERVVATEGSVAVGSILSISVMQGETEIEITGYLTIDGTYYLISYTRDDAGTITATRYFLVQFTEKAPEEVVDALTLPPFTGATVTVKDAKTYYNDDGSMYVDVFEDEHKIILLCIDAASGSSYRVESVYDAETQTYTLTVGTRKYSVKIAEGKAAIEEIVEATD